MKYLKDNMKIRYYQKIDGWRWLGFVCAMISAFILSNADVNTQWLGWGIATLSCSIWIYMGIKDKDIPRALMELMYLLLAIRAIWNWLVI
jgi:hypothetical protein